MYGIGVVLNEIREALNMAPSPEGQIVSFFATGWPIFMTVVVFGIAWGVMHITVKRLVQDMVDLKKDFKKEVEDMEGDIKEDMAGVKKELCRKIDGLDKKINHVNDKVEESFEERRVLKREYLTAKIHDLECEPRLMRVEKHMTKTLSGMKDEMFSFLRNLEEKRVVA